MEHRGIQRRALVHPVPYLRHSVQPGHPGLSQQWWSAHRQRLYRRAIQIQVLATPLANSPTQRQLLKHYRPKFLPQ